MKLYLCEGYDPLFGPIRDLVYAASIAEAKAKFLTFFGIPSLHTQIQKLCLTYTTPQQSADPSAIS
jgi:hypothetical protein